MTPRRFALAAPRNLLASARASLRPAVAAATGLAGREVVGGGAGFP